MLSRRWNLNKKLRRVNRNKRMLQKNSEGRILDAVTHLDSGDSPDQKLRFAVIAGCDLRKV